MHDECTCQSYELMMDQTPAYRVQMKHKPSTQMQGWRVLDFRGVVGVEAEWD